MSPERPAVLNDPRLATADKRIFTFLDAWRASRSGTTVPYKADFDPLQISGLLHYVWLYRFEPEIGDFVCRLAGEEVNAAWGRSIKNLTLQQIVGQDDHATIFKRWRMIVETPLVHIGSAKERLTEITHQQADRCLAPMKDQQGENTYVLGISLYRFINHEPVHMPPLSEEIVRIACADL